MTESGRDKCAEIHAAAVRRAERVVLRWWPGDHHAVANMLGKIVDILERSAGYWR